MRVPPPVLKEEAEALAIKRNAHKGKHLTHKTWRAREVDGQWKAVFEDTVQPTPAIDRMTALAAGGQSILDSMDPDTREAFQALAHQSLMSKVRRTLGE